MSRPQPEDISRETLEAMIDAKNAVEFTATYLRKEQAAELALRVARAKLAQARIDNAPPTYCAAIEAA